MIAKDCEAGRRSLRHHDLVFVDQVQQLERLRDRIKAVWKLLLRQEPAASALANPDMLVHLMDSTLDQLFDGLRHPNEQWLRDIAAASRPLREQCACTLNPLLVYFSTGELALRAVAVTTHSSHLEEILLLFHAIAQEEVNTLCSVCQRRGDAACAVNFGRETIAAKN